MKGKRLYKLINELNRTEHRQLFNSCTVSSDKRSKAFLSLLKKRNLSEKSFEEWLHEMVESWEIKDKTERDKKQRRWVDFACKEIETLLLQNYYSESEMRYHVLSQIFNKRNHQELTSYYNSKSIDSALLNRWHHVLIEEYDTSIRWLSRNQNTKNITSIKSLMKMRKQATSLHYHEAMSYFFTVNSSLFLDHPPQFADKEIIPNQADFKKMRKSSPDTYCSILYSLAEARYNFYNQQKFESLLNNCFEQIASVALHDHDKDILLRSALYVKIIAGIYYGYPIEIMSLDARQMFEYALRNGIHDTTGFFLLLLMLLIEGDFKAYDDYLRKYKTAMFIKGTEDYTSFLHAYRLFKESKHKSAVKLFMDISYSANHYLAIWSRLLEIAIHYNDGEVELCRVMLNRAKRMITSHSFPKILQLPVDKFLNNTEQLIKHGKAVHSSNNFLFYEKLMQSM